MKKILLLVISVVGMVGCGPDDVETMTGLIYGKITNSVNNEPLSGVTVTISPGGVSLITGDDGSFEYQDMQPGQYKLQAQKQDFQSNYKQISVIAGQTVSGDIRLSPVQTNVDWQLSPTELAFGSNLTELVFEIRNTGTAGAIHWNITGVDADWINVAPLDGTTAVGMSSTVKVSVNREHILKDSSTVITINIPGGSSTVRISVSPKMI